MARSNRTRRDSKEKRQKSAANDRGAKTPEDSSRTLNHKLSRVKLFLCDVDGVLTDATITVGADSETKRFHIRDGLGLMLLQGVGIQIGWISNRASFATTQRAIELKVDHLHQSGGSKVVAVENILAKTGFAWDEVCFVGDDVVDLGILRRVGVSVAVADAISEVKAMVNYVTHAGGGHGAVREVAEMILKAQGKWQRIVQHFLS